MIVSAWILFIPFSLIGLGFLNKLFRARTNLIEIFLLLISIIISASSAGVIWGGLFQ